MVQRNIAKNKKYNILLAMQKLNCYKAKKGIAIEAPTKKDHLPRPH